MADDKGTNQQNYAFELFKGIQIIFALFKGIQIKATNKKPHCYESYQTYKFLFCF